MQNIRTVQLDTGCNMAENISDRNGRALEFIIVDILIKKIPNIALLRNTNLDQKRDSVKFNELSDHQKSYFIKSADNVFTWLTGKDDFNLSNVTIERLTDDAAKKGDVTDIRIITSGNIINLSIKHNHLALKHQRPSAIASQCGFIKKSLEDLTYRKAYKKVTDDFLSSANVLRNGAQYFSELIAIQPNFINAQLYSPMCNLVCNFLNTNVSQQSNNAQDFFNFIRGMTDYHKIVVDHKKIEIYEFASVSSVTSLTAALRKDSYIDVSFSNGWDIAMRLHTASSEIKGVSLKFDTQLISMKVPIKSIPL